MRYVLALIGGLVASPALAQPVPPVLPGHSLFPFPANAVLHSDALNAAITGRADAANLGPARVTIPGVTPDTLANILSGVAAMPGQQVTGTPLIPTCPVSNCPIPGVPGFGGAYAGPTMSAIWNYGKSTNTQNPQFFAQDGFYVSHGGDSGGRGQYVARYVGAMQGPGAGVTWALNTDIVRGACAGGFNSLYGQPGSGIPFGDAGCTTAPGSLGSAGTIGYELDLSNFDADSTTHGAFITGLYISTGGRFTSGGGISFGNNSGAASQPSWHHGIEFSPNTVKDAVVYDLSNASLGWLAQGTHSVATLQDETLGPSSIVFIGLKSVADMKSVSASPAVLSMTGAHSFASIFDGSSSPSALSADGTYSVGAINVRGTGPSAFVASGTFSFAAFTSVGATAAISLEAKAGQQICISGIFACVSYSTVNHKWYFTDGTNAIVASIADGGNLIIKGTLTQSATP